MSIFLVQNSQLTHDIDWNDIHLCWSLSLPNHEKSKSFNSISWASLRFLHLVKLLFPAAGLAVVMSSQRTVALALSSKAFLTTI